MCKFLFAMLLASGATWASSIYEVRFVGTFDQGAFAFTFGLDGQSLRQDLSGETLRGKIRIVMDALPAPSTITAFETGYETIGRSPLWLHSAEFSVDNLTGFPNSIFQTGPYFVDSVPVPADGTEQAPAVYQQRFGVAESISFLRLGVTTQDSWTNPEFRTFLRAGIWALNAQGLSGTPYDPLTGEFRPISGAPSFSTGFVEYQSARTVDDTTQGQLGFIENTFVRGSFRATSVNGDVLVPEPATAWVALTGLGLLVVSGRRKQR